MCLALVMASPAVFAGNLEAVGGMTFNTFDLTLSEGGEDGTMGLKDVGNGNGMYVGGRYWLGDKLALGLGYDSLKSQPSFRMENDPDYYELGLKLDMSGLYGEVVYQLTDYIKVKGALANYNMTAKYYEDEYSPADVAEEEIAKGSGMGYIFGGEMSYPLKGNLSLNSVLGYRTASLKLDEPVYTPSYAPEPDPEQNIDVTGIFFSVGLGMAF